MRLFLIAVVLLGLAVAAFVLIPRLRANTRAASAQLPPPHATPAAVDAALQPYRAALEASRRPVLRIALADFPKDELLSSKVGGRAWWPQGEPVPTGEAGTPLILLAQLNFAELPASPAYPHGGLLQFFIHGDDYYGANFQGDFSVASLSEQRNFRVVYWPDTSVQSQGLPVASDADVMTPHEPTRPRRMTFTAGTEPMSSADYRFERLVGGNAYATFEAWAKANGHDASIVDDIFQRLDGSGHKVGGYPHFTQSDPRQGGAMELLLQLDTDDPMMWGDSGVGAFFIDPADLARGDFGRVMYHWDCY